MHPDLGESEDEPKRRGRNRKYGDQEVVRLDHIVPKHVWDRVQEFSAKWGLDPHKALWKIVGEALLAGDEAEAKARRYDLIGEVQVLLKTGASLKASRDKTLEQHKAMARELRALKATMAFRDPEVQRRWRRSQDRRVKRAREARGHRRAGVADRCQLPWLQGPGA